MRPAAHAHAAAFDDEDAALLERPHGGGHGLAPALDRQVGPARAQPVEQRVDAPLEIPPLDRGPHRGRHERRRRHLVEQADRLARPVREVEHVAPRRGVVVGRADRRAEGREGARPVPDRVAHHFGQLVRERPLAPLHSLPGEDAILEHEVVGNGHRQDDQVVHARLHRRVDEAGLRRLQFAAVAPAPLDVKEQIVRPEQFPDIRLERDQVRRVLRVATDRDGPGDVAVQQAERSAEEVDARRDDRRPHVVIVERQRLEQVVGVALVIGRVDHVSGRGRRDRAFDMLDVPVDLPQDRVERVLERPVERVALRRPQLLEVGVHPLPSLAGVLAVGALQVAHDFVAREYGLRDVVGHGSRL